MNDFKTGAEKLVIDSLCLLCFYPRKRLSAEWRKLRSSSTRSSSSRTPLQETRRELMPAVEARNSPSKTASPPACRGPLTSWGLRGKACGSERLWTRLLLLASPAQTLTPQASKWGLKRLGPPPAPCSSRIPPGRFFKYWYTDLAEDFARLWSVVFRPAETRIVAPRPPSSPTERRAQRANRVRLRAKRSASRCGGPGPDHSAATQKLNFYRF